MTQRPGKGSAQGCSPAGLEEKVEDGPGASHWSPVHMQREGLGHGEGIRGLQLGNWLLRGMGGQGWRLL